MDLGVKRQLTNIAWMISVILALGGGSTTYAQIDAGTILGTKHDFTGLNERVGVVAMSGLAFSDYGNPCVYCHIPPEKEGRNR